MRTQCVPGPFSSSSKGLGTRLTAIMQDHTEIKYTPLPVSRLKYYTKTWEGRGNLSIYIPLHAILNLEQTIGGDMPLYVA